MAIDSLTIVKLVTMNTFKISRLFAQLHCSRSSTGDPNGQTHRIDNRYTHDDWMVGEQQSKESSFWTLREVRSPSDFYPSNRAIRRRNKQKNPLNLRTPDHRIANRSLSTDSDFLNRKQYVESRVYFPILGSRFSSNEIDERLMVLLCSLFHWFIFMHFCGVKRKVETVHCVMVLKMLLHLNSVMKMWD
ncbi:hypothetical protein EPI10_014339 [Gossypium australe]|uniref:Uncharacterized protein n=1 Tax=Gossypium australe TaxID=47621 RepID=A0A5B6VHD4_9ROSI|nr:hypothetical protein EPI10_014339 [Gossypium australe]